MMNFSMPQMPFSLPPLLVFLMALAPLSSWAGEGHDHGEPPAAASGPTSPRFTATSETFELVGVVEGQHITLYLDRTTDNSPVKEAQLELELGGTKLDVSPHGDAEFEAMLPTTLQPGEISVSATVIAGTESDLLVGALDVHAEPHADNATHGTTWKTYSAWAAGVGLTLVVLVALRTFAMRRLAAHRNHRLGGAA
jgi:hypothetical protein